MQVMPSFRVGDTVEAYFESSDDSSLNGLYPATITAVREEVGCACRYDLFYDDGDYGPGSTQTMTRRGSLPSQFLENVEEEHIRETQLALPEVTYKPCILYSELL